MQTAQALAQVENGLAFAQDQSVYRHSGLRGDFFEFIAFDFVRDESFALFRCEFFQGGL